MAVLGQGHWFSHLRDAVRRWFISIAQRLRRPRVGDERHEQDQTVRCRRRSGGRQDDACLHGMVQLYEDRRAVELSLLHRLSAQTLVLDVSDLDWRRCRREVRAFVVRIMEVEA
jgi:hypothetical protein